MSSAPVIVSCVWLKQTLEEDSTDLIITDVSRYRSGRNARQEYESQHIPGAVFLDLFANVELTASKPWNAATADEFESLLQSAGINNQSRVILYSTTERFGYFLSARAWWMFKHFGHTNMSILDGGLDKWIKLGFPVSADVPSVQTGNFTARIQPDLLTFDAMRSLLSDGGKHQVCDSRPHQKYTGQDSAGHIVSALNIPADKLVDEHHGVLKSVDEMKEVFHDAGVDLTRPVATYCNSGMSSCMLAMAAQMCGAIDTLVYLDGFLDWMDNADANEIIKETKQDQ